MVIKLFHGACAAEIDTMGGELTSYRDGAGVEWLWQGDPAYWAGHNPVLFPVVGRLKDDRVRVDGVEYAMPRHGFAKEKSFTPVETGPNWVLLELRDDVETRACYPFHFLFQVRHTLIDGGFRTSFRVANPWTDALLFCLGAHPALRCPMGAGETFEEYALIFDEGEYTTSCVPTAEGYLSRTARGQALNGRILPLNYAMFDREDTLIYEGVRSKGVCLVHRGTGRGVRVDFDGFPILAFWSPAHKNAPFLCVEPWHGCGAWVGESGTFEDKPHCVRLEPGQQFTAGFEVTALMEG